MTKQIETKLSDPKTRSKAIAEVLAISKKNHGTLTPELILGEAQKKSNPLHAFFCWDDTEAAREYRKIQAAMLIRRIKVTITTNDDRQIRVRAFVNVVEPKPKDEDPKDLEGHGVNARQRGIYVSLDTACKVDDYRSQMILQCKRDIEAFRVKYSALSEVAEIITAMESFTTSFEL